MSHCYLPHIHGMIRKGDHWQLCIKEPPHGNILDHVSVEWVRQETASSLAIWHVWLNDQWSPQILVCCFWNGTLWRLCLINDLQENAKILTLSKHTQRWIKLWAYTHSSDLTIQAEGVWKLNRGKDRGWCTCDIIYRASNNPGLFNITGKLAPRQKGVFNDSCFGNFKD